MKKQSKIEFALNIMLPVVIILGVIALGFLLIPGIFLIVILVTVLFFYLVWPKIVAGKVPMWMWREIIPFDSVPHGTIEESDKLSYERTVIWGIFELRILPSQAVWVVRNSLRFDAETLEGYREYQKGWRWIWFPELFRITEGMVDSRVINIDPKEYEVNTAAGKIFINTQVTLRKSKKSGSATKILIRKREALTELLHQYLTPIANYITSGVSDVDLIRRSPSQLVAMAASGADLANKGSTIIRIKDPSDLDGLKEIDDEVKLGESDYATFDGYGLELIELRIQDIHGAEETMDAIARLTVAKLDTQIVEQVAARVGKLTDQGVAPTWALIAEYVRPLLETGRGSFLPAMKVEIGSPSPPS